MSSSVVAGPDVTLGTLMALISLFVLRACVVANSGGLRASPC
jgi:hypothetical protein